MLPATQASLSENIPGMLSEDRGTADRDRAEQRTATGVGFFDQILASPVVYSLFI